MADPKKLHRRDAPETSREAAYTVKAGRLEDLVAVAIHQAGPGGAIADDILRAFPRYPYSSITARFAALARAGRICYTGEKRPGASGCNQRVMVHADYHKPAGMRAVLRGGPRDGLALDLYPGTRWLHIPALFRDGIGHVEYTRTEETDAFGRVIFDHTRDVKANEDAPPTH